MTTRQQTHLKEIAMQHGSGDATAVITSLVVVQLMNDCTLSLEEAQAFLEAHNRRAGATCR